MRAKKTVIKLGSVSFLNAKPITYAIENGLVEHDFSIVQTPPSELSGMLSRNEIDLGLIPVAEFLKKGTYSAVPGISISSYGKVDSVVLLAKGKLKDARTVAVDLRSQSSTALLRVILEVFHGLKPAYTPRDTTKEGFLDGVDAGMIIGDLGLEMMYAPPAGYNVYDLGEIWTAETGLPFVFAVFAVNRGVSLGRNVGALEESKAYGLAHAAEIARLEAARLGMDERVCVTYLTERIQYDLGPREQEGIVKYSEFLSELGISKRISGVRFTPKRKTREVQSPVSRQTMRLGHSPDADDAFMFYGVAKDKVTSDKIEFVHVIEDIQSLNKRALNKELEMTAISAHGYLKVQDDYRILASGASMGEGYGPIVVARERFERLAGRKIGVPGMLTSAYLLLCIYADGFIPVEMPFDEIMPAVANGDIETGLLIHEGQLTYKESGLELLFDLGELWEKETPLPMPLGLNVVRRDIPEDLQREILRVHKGSIEYGLSHKDEALEYALEFGRGMKEDVGEKFVLMYVNDYTIDLGEKGKAALEYLFNRAHEKGIIKEQPRLDILEL